MTLLGAAIALYVAVRLIESVAPTLIAIAVVIAIAFTAMVIVRHRKTHW